MKKILTVILVAVMLITPVLAHEDNANAGTVPKTVAVPVIDGVKDALYDNGLLVPVRNGHSATPDGGLGGGADAWLLWDDEHLYVFMHIDLAGPTLLPDDYDSRVKFKAQWELTTVEVLIDFSNVADAGSNVCQFRLDDRGFPNVTIGSGTGYFDMNAYTQFMDNSMSDYVPTDADLEKGFASIPNFPGL